MFSLFPHPKFGGEHADYLCIKPHPAVLWQMKVGAALGHLNWCLIAPARRFAGARGDPFCCTGTGSGKAEGPPPQSTNLCRRRPKAEDQNGTLRRREDPARFVQRAGGVCCIPAKQPSPFPRTRPHGSTPKISPVAAGHPPSLLFGREVFGELCCMGGTASSPKGLISFPKCHTRPALKPSRSQNLFRWRLLPHPLGQFPHPRGKLERFDVIPS